MKNDYIKITGLEVYARHGVYQEEKEKGQTFVINAKVYYDMSLPAGSDHLKEALNYADLCHFIKDVMKERSFDLIEAAAENLAERILIHFDKTTGLDLELCKPNAPIGLPFEQVSVNVSRAWHRVFLSIGSNMGDKKMYLNEATGKFLADEKVRDMRVSEYIETEPYGMTEQDAFLNGAIELWTIYSPRQLLDLCHHIEEEAQRVRTIHWGPRTLDVDILFYDDMIYDSENLIIPHVDIENRDFVLRPMNELAPGFVHPLYRKTMQGMLQELAARNEENKKIDEEN